jgi:hypothetical protein
MCRAVYNKATPKRLEALLQTPACASRVTTIQVQQYNSPSDAKVIYTQNSMPELKVRTKGLVQNQCHRASENENAKVRLYNSIQAISSFSPQS